MSVPGIGTATATEIVIATAGRPRNEMKAITDPKKIAASAVRLPRWGCPVQVVRHRGTSRGAVYEEDPG